VAPAGSGRMADSRVFRGTYQHAMDAKGRTSLPSKFREQVSSSGADYVIVTQGPDKALWAFTPAAWQTVTDALRAKSMFDRSVRGFISAFVSPAQDCPFDKMGRVLIPQMLRDYAGLGEGEVVWAGAIDRIELWSKGAWERRSAETLAMLDGDPFGT